MRSTHCTFPPKVRKSRPFSTPASWCVGRAPDRRSRVNNLAPVAFTVRGELLETRPDIVARYLERALRTAAWARGNPIEAKRLIARDSSVAEEWVDTIYSPGVVEALEPSLDPTLIALLENQKDFLLEWGFIDDDFSVSDWVAHEPLAEARRRIEDGRRAES